MLISLENRPVSFWPPEHVKSKMHPFLRGRRGRDTLIDVDKYGEEIDLLDRLSSIEDLLERRDATNTTSQNETNPMQLLDQVLEKIDDIQTRPKPGGKKSGDCQMEGQWASDAAGGLFNLISAEDGSKEVVLHRTRPHDRAHNGFMNYQDWNMSLTIPYGNSSQYIIINAWNHRDKLVATFMGECRVCRSKEVLQGSWTIVSHSRDCESEGSTAKLISDVFRRDQIDVLRKQHINKVKTKSRKNKETHTTVGMEEILGSNSPSNPKEKHHKTEDLHIKLH